MKHAIFAFIACLSVAAPVTAQDITENETMVLHIVFDECLAFAEQGRTPFSDMPTQPMTAAAQDIVPLRIRETGQYLHLFSPRYTAAWGADEQTRYCMVTTDPTAIDAMVLGVVYAGFIDRFTDHAASAGLTNAYPDNDLSPLVTSTWEVPDMPESQRLSITLMPTGASTDQSILDVGIIMVTAGIERPTP